MDADKLHLRLGVKTDPIEYRYSYEWLFALLADEGIQHVQLGTWFEMYRLPDRYFQKLARQAQDHGLKISSIFTSHRELGGFFHSDPDWHAVGRDSYKRLIEIGALVGAASVGSNPGAVLRDQMKSKPAGVRRYLDHMKEMMRYARLCGVSVLTIEPMSCLAEPPTLSEEIVDFAEEMRREHLYAPHETVPVRYCADISHGYADAQGTVRCDNFQMMEACLPFIHELHLRNTDSRFEKTFGFTPLERMSGIVDIAALRRLFLHHAACLPAQSLVGYLEIGGPKTGRDYTDGHLEPALRGSLAYLKKSFLTEPTTSQDLTAHAARAARSVQIAPSMMCADICHLEDDLRRLEQAGVDLLHFDLMDGHFVPNMPLGLAVLEQLRSRTALPFDVHLMVDDNAFFIEKLLKIGVDYISVHAETAVHLDRTLASIRAAGVKAGVALNPSTPLSVLSYVTEQMDYILLMTVNPGFAGQTLVPAALRKIADCREFLRGHGCDVPIEVDGSVSFEMIPAMVAAGADILVAGTSSVFRTGSSILANVARARECADAGVSARQGIPQ